MRWNQRSTWRALAVLTVPLLAGVTGPAAAAREPAAAAAPVAVAPAGSAAGPARPARSAQPAQRWVGTWSTGVTGAATAPVPATVFDRQTLRQVVHTSLAGHSVRVRLSNEFGTEPLRVGAAHVARRAEGPRISARTDRVLTFGGRPTITIPAGAPVLSDPVDLDVPAGTDLAVSLYLPRRTRATTVHASAFQRSYVADGDVVGRTTLDDPAVTTSWAFLSGVSVAAAPRAVAIVALGDSITDGANTTVGANARWTDVLARRLRARADLRRLAVLNEGIGGNRLLHDGNTVPGSPAAGVGPLFGPSALSRFDRDVLAQPGARYVTVLLGINDIGHPTSVAPASEAVSVTQLLTGYRQLIARAHERGLKIIGATMTPFRRTTIAGYYTREGEAKRLAVNRWIRTSGEWDAVIDFDRAVRDPEHPLRMLPRYDSGDHLHPNDAGMRAMANAIDLDVFTGGPRATSPAHPVVTTDRGAVRGVRSGSVDSFLGIRYAAAPSGAGRWAPPRRAPRWSGVRAATRYGSRCPAAASTNGPRSVDEDCLFVNVQRPSGLRPGVRRPVYVFIHGGGLVNGSSNQADSAPIVRSTGVVAVTMNYRLGVLGFLGHPALTARDGDSGNYGLMDQQAALRWVRRNIARFGGDPSRVTIGGESAGGWSVCTHLVAPESRGLFARAMIQSGSCPSRTQTQADADGRALAAAVHCTDPDTALACLRRTPVGALIDAPNNGFFLPVRGTRLLPRDPRVAVSTGRFARVPVVIGANRDEGRTFTQGNLGWDRDRYTAWLRQSFGADADAVLARYPWPARADRFTGAYLSGAVTTDAGLIVGIGGCPNRQLTRDLARHTRTWAYEFDHRTGPGLTPEPVGYVWGAGHAAELAYLFPSFDNGTPIAATFDVGERRLAREMKRYWGTFARRGAPDAAGQPHWARFDTTGQVLSLRAAGRSRLVSDARLAAEHQCGFWDAHPVG